MLFAPYRLSDRCLVIALTDFIDIDNTSAVASELSRTVRTGRERTVVIDIRTAGVTSAALDVLLRVRRTARAYGVVVSVVARHPLTRTVLRIAGMDQVLRVRSTLAESVSAGGGCTAPVHTPTDS